jgi:hypothetical protein
MATKDLIDAAESAKAALAQAQIDAAAGQQALADAAADLSAKSQAVYDDLTANGVALYTNDAGENFIAAPVDPDTFSLTPIRTA